MPNKSLKRQRSIQRQISLQRHNHDNSSSSSLKRTIPTSRRFEDKYVFHRENANANNSYSIDPNVLATVELHALEVRSSNNNNNNNTNPRELQPQQQNQQDIVELIANPEPVRLPRVARHEQRSVGKHADVVTILFAIRRPGCGACRMQAQALADLAKSDQSISLVGVVKHVRDVSALHEFQTTYFGNHSIYLDREWSIFTNALGNRKISALRFLRLKSQMNERYRRHNVEHHQHHQHYYKSTCDDIWTQGGAILMDRQGNVRYIDYENYGEQRNLSDLKAAIADARDHPLPRHVDRKKRCKQQ